MARQGLKPGAWGHGTRTMAADMGNVRQGFAERLIGRLNLRFPTVFLLFVGLTVVNMIIPDPIPLIDEIGLALIAAMFGLWKRRRHPTPVQR
jgi:uncharacterized membrane protein YccC